MSVWMLALRHLLLPPLLNPLAEREPKRILEIGCGTGGTTRILLDRFPGAVVTAVDIDLAAVAAAAANVRDPRATFAVADATRLPFADSSFDLVIELNAFHHVEKWTDAIAECARVTAHGGAFAAMDENVGAWGRLFRFLDRPSASFSSREFSDAARAVGLTQQSKFGDERFMRLIFSKPASLSHSPAA